MAHSIPLTWLNITVIAAYVAVIVGIGVLAGRGGRKAQDYFLAGRSLRWPVVGTALFATNISTIHLVGLAAGGYDLGLVIGNFEWMAVATLVLFSLVFAPAYFRSGISTIPEYIQKRYNGVTRTAVAVISIASALFVHIGISLYAGASLIESFFGIGATYSIITIAFLTAFYTIIGGLRAVVWTEALQAVLLVLGAVCITIFGVFALPDIGVTSIAEFQIRLPSEHMDMLQPIRSADGELNEYSWLGVVVGYPVLGIWYWCTDQTIVQRALGARSEYHAQLGGLTAGVLKVLPVFFMVFPGLIAFVLFGDIIADQPNRALPVLITQLVPVGLQGLIIACLLAALMSTVSGALHSCATLFSVDIVKRLAPSSSERTLVFCGRSAVVLIMLLATAWSTQGGKFGSIFEAINKIPISFAPSISVIFLFGVLWKRGSSAAATTTLAIGFLVGLILLIVDLPLLGDTRIVSDKWGIPFMLQGAILFIANSFLYVITSYILPDKATVYQERVNAASTFSSSMTGGQKTQIRLISVCVLLGLGLLYAVFA